MTIYELREKSLKIAHEARDLLNTVKNDNSNLPEVQEQFERMMKDSNDFAFRADSLETVENRDKAFNSIITDVSGANVEARGSATNDDETRAAAFGAYLRGEKSLGELRAMGVGDKDGAITPKSFTTTLLTHLRSETPMLDGNFVTLLETADGNTIEMPTFDDTDAAVIIAENAQMEEDDLSFDSKSLGAYKYTSKIVRVSNELLQDGSVPVEGIITSALAKRIARGVGAHLTTGTDTNQPAGVITSASVGVTAALGNAVAAEELIKLKYAIDPAYHAASKWMFETQGFVKFQTLKDAENRFIWQPGMTVGAPDRLLGLPYVLNPDMNSAFTTGKIVAAVGDFSKYVARRSGGLRLVRLSERYADYDQVGFVVLGRWDGVLTDDQAIKTLKLA